MYVCISEFPQETRFNVSRFHEFKKDNMPLLSQYSWFIVVAKFNDIEKYRDLIVFPC